MIAGLADCYDGHIMTLTRRSFAATAATIPMLTETALAQRAAIQGAVPEGTVWLNANENPEGPPRQSIEAMIEVLPKSGRYHYQEYRDFYAAVAKSEGMEAEQLLIGSGSSEVLQAAVHAFTAPDRPLIQLDPTYESVAAVAEALGRRVIRVPLTSSWGADVKKLAEHASREGGGLIYFCNPNNPTSSVTPKSDVDWLIANLPANTVLLMDEAYIHFSESPEMASAFPHVKAGRNVIVSRSYSKIWGMAGLRAGAMYARPDLVKKMEPFRNNVISIVAVRALLGGLPHAASIIGDRRTRYNAIRAETCAWLKKKGIGFIEPNANFIMIDLGAKDVRQVHPALIARGVAAGRPFPPLYNMLRVSVGSAVDMEKFRQAFWDVYSA
jgi:histidinol-phosphate/aromatic aminotransferase/cobyric acid decarboxylase-like protein